MANCLTINFIVAAFALATLAFSSTETTRIESLKRRLSNMRHRRGDGGFVEAESMAYVGGPGGHDYAYRPHYAVPAEPTAASSASATAAARAHHAAPSAPVYGYNVHTPKYNNFPNQRYQSPVAPHGGRYQFNYGQHPVRAPHYTHDYHMRPSSGGASAAASAASSSHGGGAASSTAAASSGGSTGGHHGDGVANAHVAQEEHFHEHFEEPETENTYAAQAGTYLNDGHGSESSSYVRATENVENHEDGKEDENHYYNANSYGKTYDENHHEAYNNDDEDVLHTPNVYRSKKSKTNYVADLNKARRESGSGVLAHDKRSSAYNKDSRRFKENVDQRFNKEGSGMTNSHAFSSAEEHEDEDEEHFDSDNLGNFVGVDGHVHHKHPGFVKNLGGAGGAAASSSAASDAHGNGVATSSVAAGQNAAASSSGHSA